MMPRVHEMEAPPLSGVQRAQPRVFELHTRAELLIALVEGRVHFLEVPLDARQDFGAAATFRHRELGGLEAARKVTEIDDHPRGDTLDEALWQPSRPQLQRLAQVADGCGEREVE